MRPSQKQKPLLRSWPRRASKALSQSPAATPATGSATTNIVAVTGGTGFVGGALLSELISAGYRVKALARSTSKLDRFADSTEIIEGSLSDERAIADLCEGAQTVVHCAGLTHALTDAAFQETNVEGARRVAAAASDAGSKFVHLSSMAARAPHLSPYAQSKFDSEGAVAEASVSGAWIALRLPAIYGPGDMATLPYFKLVRSGLAPEPAAEPSSRVSILFVEDVVQAIIAAMEKAPTGKVYEVADEREDGFTWAEIGESLGRAFGRKPRRLRVPRPILASYAGLIEAGARLIGKPTMMTRAKIAEFFHPDWVARDQLLTAATDWQPQTPLDEGFAKTVRWYQERKMV